MTNHIINSIVIHAPMTEKYIFVHSSLYIHTYPFTLAMVYLGFGILAASLSFLFYKHGLPTPSSVVEVWRRLNFRNSASAPPRSPPIAAKERGGDRGTEKNVLRESDEGFVGDERSDVATTTTTSQPRAREKEEELFTIQNTTGPAIPTFTLTNDDDGANSRQEDDDDKTPVQSPKLKLAIIPPLPQFPTQPASHLSMTPTPSLRPEDSSRQKPFSTISNNKNATSIMPPPPRPTTVMRPSPKPSSLITPLSPPPSIASTLRVPSLTTRSLPPSTLSLGGSTLSTSTLPLPKRPSRKVLLAVGHSPLDWANLLRQPPTPSYFRGPNLPPHLIRVPPSLLRTHNGRKGNNAWGVFQGKVYNLTPYLNFHPGGVGELLRGAGKAEEGEKLFNEIHPWVSWESILGECLIGILVSESEGLKEAEDEGLDGMD